MAGRIPQNFIDDLISRSDIVEVINARVPLKRKGKEYSACCPFHNEKTPSFTVSENKQFFYCFGCHAKGNVIGFLMDYEHLSYVDAIESLAADAHVDVPHEGNVQADKNRQDKQPFYDILKQASELFQQQLKNTDRASNYLKQRGLSGEIAKRFKIGYAPNSWDFLISRLANKNVGNNGVRDKLVSDPVVTDPMLALLKTGLIVSKDNNKTYDRFRDRIIFPITDQRGRVIGFGGRILDQGEPKYLNSPENTVFHKGYELYGLYEIKQAIRKIERIIVVEGYMDVVALAQHDINYAVASLGTATTTEQIQKAFRTTHEVIFCYDGDNAGKKAAWRALENTLTIIRDGMIAKFLFLPEKEDPDTMIRNEGKQAFEQRIQNATPLSEFLFTHLKAETNINTNEGKAQLASHANKLIQTMHNSLFKDLLVEELSSLIGLSQQHLEAKITNNAQQKIPYTKKQTSKRGQQILINKTRIAVALLLQNPQLATQHKVPDSFQQAFKKGLPLLHTLQQTINTNTDISSAALLERFRGSEYENALYAMSILQTPETENTDNMLNVYKNIIERLCTEDRYQYLTDRLEQHQQLSEAEMQEYIALSTQSEKPAS